MDLLKISFCISVAGILILLFIANSLEPQLSKISELNEKMLNQKVKIIANITSAKNTNQSSIIIISDSTGSIMVLADKANFSTINKYKNNQIEVIGKLDEYKNNLQIIAEKITLNNH